MRARTYAAITIAALALPAAGHAQQVRPGITLTIEVAGEAGEAAILPVTYDCGGTALAVTYVNAEPNLLAIVPVEGRSTLFASVISGSGARYAGGRYEWWSKGDEATLRDLTAGDGAEPVLTCKAAQG